MVPPLRICGDPAGVQEAAAPPSAEAVEPPSVAVVEPPSEATVLAAAVEPSPLEQAARAREEIIAATAVLDIAGTTAPVVPASGHCDGHRTQSPPDRSATDPAIRLSKESTARALLEVARSSPGLPRTVTR
jgi:hypothetical protein